jgi:RHH-type rel operon transcriptional repressor/antitoxin RelB
MATSIRLPAGVEDRLNHLAARTGRTKAYYLREMIERGIDEAEEYYLAAETSERVRKGEERIYSTDQIRADLGLDD